MKNLSMSKKIGIGIVLIQLIATVSFIISLLRLGMFPEIYLAAGVMIPCLLWIIIFLPLASVSDER